MMLVKLNLALVRVVCSHDRQWPAWPFRSVTAEVLRGCKAVTKSPVTERAQMSVVAGRIRGVSDNGRTQRTLGTR